MEPRIEMLKATKVVGKKTRMSYGKNTTVRLWQEFMPLRTQIADRRDKTLWSIEVYDDMEFFRNFDPAREFDKWAAVPVSSLAPVPDELQTLIIPAGQYAIYSYKGTSVGVSELYRYIYGTWIPNSKYTLDHRPHFAIMGSKYKGDHPDSEEEIWIPVKEKPAMR